MNELKVLLLSDGRPGHYHLAEGVGAALARLGSASIRELRIDRNSLIPTRILRRALSAGLPPRLILRLGYGVGPQALGDADLVLSAGGETLPANVAAARALDVPNIFCGSLRDVPPEDLSLVITSYERFAGRPRHLVTLKPSAMDPDALGRPAAVPVFNGANRPQFAGLLIGGDSGLFRYRTEEWQALIAFLRALSAAWGTRWLISTSRRTDRSVGEAVFELAKDKNVVADFIDYRWAGPGTLPKLFGRSDIVVCTEDSSTMLSEAIAARLPVIGVAPEHHSFKPEEAEYRQWLLANDWCRCLSIANLGIETFSAALGDVRPMPDNHLDRLAADIKDRLPQLFRA